MGKKVVRKCKFFQSSKVSRILHTCERTLNQLINYSIQSLIDATSHWT